MADREALHLPGREGASDPITALATCNEPKPSLTGLRIEVVRSAPPVSHGGCAADAIAGRGRRVVACSPCAGGDRPAARRRDLTCNAGGVMSGTSAEGALVIVWGQAVRGREHQALEVFQESLAYYTRLQQAGEITSFEPVALEPSGGSLAGFTLIRGDAARLQRLRISEEFLRLNNRVLHIVDNFGVHTGFVGENMQRLYADWGAQAVALQPTRTGAEQPAYAPR